MSDTLLAYDLGTGGNKASLYGADGSLIATAFVAYDTLYPQAGWHEQRPEAWWESVVGSPPASFRLPPAVARTVPVLVTEPLTVSRPLLWSACISPPLTSSTPI